MRSVLSAVAVLLLGVFAYLFFTDYFRTPQAAKPGDFLTSHAHPPATPVPVVEQPPVRPVVAPVPPAPVTPSAPPVVLAPPEPFQPSVPAPQPEARTRQTHVVQRGDTLSSISRLHYGSEAFFTKIAAANGLRNQDRIRVGQVLILPEISAAAVQQAETAARPSEPDAATSTLPPDFEPIPPTLNITVPRK